MEISTNVGTNIWIQKNSRPYKRKTKLIVLIPIALASFIL